MNETPIPIGTRVRYHGGISSYHGEYTVEGYSDPEILSKRVDGKVAEYYSDGVGYDLWPVGVPKKFCEREKALYFVRRQSITPIEDSDDA